MDSLADTAQFAVRAIDRCLTPPSQQPDRGAADLALTLIRTRLADKWITLLASVLAAATAIHAGLCDHLADHAALAEEHRPSSPDGQQLTAATLASAAHALRQETS